MNIYGIDRNLPIFFSYKIWDSEQEVIFSDVYNLASSANL